MESPLPVVSASMMTKYERPNFKLLWLWGCRFQCRAQLRTLRRTIGDHFLPGVL
jgi:hypothetical protein